MKDIKDMDPTTVKTMHTFYHEEFIKWVELREEKSKELQSIQNKLMEVAKEASRCNYYVINTMTQIDIIETAFPELKADPNKLN